MQHDLRVEDGVAFLLTSGPADLDGWIVMHEALIAHGDYRPGMPILIDHSALDWSTLSADAVRSVGDLVVRCDEAEGWSPIAVVTEVGYGLARMAQAQVSDVRRPVRICRTRAEALGWIEELSAAG